MPTLGPKFPETWRSFGQPMRKGFDVLAKGLTQGETEKVSLARLGEVMRNCVATVPIASSTRKKPSAFRSTGIVVSIRIRSEPTLGEATA